VTVEPTLLHLTWRRLTYWRTKFRERYAGDTTYVL